MAVTEPRPGTRPAGEPANGVPAATLGEDILTVLFGAWLIGGFFVDAWSHINITDTLEGFFTPWHAVLYSGFAATAAWTSWLAYRRRDRTDRWWSAWPPGYLLGALGVVIFLAGGVGDAFWHEILGVEVGLDALLSPTHLLLLVGGVLVLTSPARSAWHRPTPRLGLARTITAVVALALGTAVAGLFLSYVNAFAQDAPTVRYVPRPTDQGVISLIAEKGLGSYLATTALLVIPLLFAYRHRTVPGSATALVTGVAMFTVGIRELPQPQTTATLAAIAAAVLVDVLLVRLDAIRGADAPLRLPIAGGLFALVWPAHLLGLHLAAPDGLRWPPEMWTGAPVLALLAGFVLGGLASRPQAAPAGAINKPSR